MSFSTLFRAGLLAALALAMAAPAALAQSKNYRGYARVAVGLNVTRPGHLPGHFKPTETWTGIHYRTNWLELGYLNGRCQAVEGAPEPTQSGQQYYIGASFPIGRLGLGRRIIGTKGILVQPFIGGGVGLIKLKNFGTMGKQFYAAPGVSVQFPYALVDFRAVPQYTTEGDGDAEPLHGWTFQPQLAIQFDALWDVFSPKTAYNGHASGVNSYTTRTQTGSEVRGDYVYNTYRETTTSVPYDFDMYVTDGGSFWALMPRATWVVNSGYRGNTLLPGLGLAGRAGPGSLDAFVEYGQLGLASSWNQQPNSSTPTPRDGEVDRNDDQFSGTRRAGRVLARVGLDLPALCQAFFFHSDGGGGGTKFFRVTGGWGGGYAVPFGDVTFRHPEQVAALDQQFAETKLSNGQTVPSATLRNEFSDPRMGRSGFSSQWYFQVEVGVASLSFESNKYRNNPLANGSTVTLAYLIPAGRIKEARQKARIGKQR